MSRLRRFGSFWWDFVVGDDWRLAVCAALALAITAVVADQGASAWWITPLMVTVNLVITVRVTSRRVTTPKPESPGDRVA
jgi:hypothetical protein